jgi:hypothetical protein
MQASFQGWRRYGTSLILSSRARPFLGRRFARQMGKRREGAKTTALIGFLHRGGALFGVCHKGVEAGVTVERL